MIQSVNSITIGYKGKKTLKLRPLETYQQCYTTSNQPFIIVQNDTV